MSYSFIPFIFFLPLGIHGENFKVVEAGVNVVRLRKKFTRSVFSTSVMNSGGGSLDFQNFAFFESP